MRSFGGDQGLGNVCGWIGRQRSHRWDRFERVNGDQSVRFQKAQKRDIHVPPTKNIARACLNH